MDNAIRLQTLDTSYVNLGALIRHLRQRNFVGRLNVLLDDYEADVFVYGSEEPSVWENDHSTGRSAQGKEAMERLMVRAREPGGLITIYQQADESDDVEELPPAEKPSDIIETREFSPAAPTTNKAAATKTPQVVLGAPGEQVEPLEEVNWDELLRASGGLVATIERAVQDGGEDFGDLFRSARVEIGDDYPLMDPTGAEFQYADSTVRMRERPTASVYVLSLTEALRRVISKVAAGKDGACFREQVAVELAVAARQRENAFAEFTPQLDRIAGTRVL